ncbi:pirin family protein [Gordonia alkaliphila]|uniref:pirin family protein n=1 Tax=Gordonia alkaliphila TaxID=1053547 RepID=UPI001FF5F914|nr:pirin family protein [Gordonia alkaliphila]MCK0440649.1 pirin family protein [Gordonia alkaliphila]
MSNVEVGPVETECTGAPESGLEVIPARRVPLGGPRAMLVQRTLPTKDRSMVGAWCFADHYGPDRVDDSGGMRVLPHPHTGLATVSWLFEGEIEHTDSNGVHAMVRPGELNLMSAGYGISHSEISTPETDVLHGVQLWLALPDADRNGQKDFQFHAPESVPLPGDVGSVRVFIGTLVGSSSPVSTSTPMLGAEIILDAGAEVTVEVDPSFEHGALLDTDTLRFDGVELERSAMGYAGPGRSTLTLANPGATQARIILLGGVPFDEDLIMWWNFVGRTHEEIVEYREQWEEHAERFGTVAGWTADERIPAPPLPNSRLRPRRRAR